MEQPENTPIEAPNEDQLSEVTATPEPSPADPNRPIRQVDAQILKALATAPGDGWIMTELLDELTKHGPPRTKATVNSAIYALINRGEAISRLVARDGGNRKQAHFGIPRPGEDTMPKRSVKRSPAKKATKSTQKLVSEREKLERERDKVAKQLETAKPRKVAAPVVAEVDSSLVNGGAMIKELERIAESAANLFAHLLQPMLEAAVARQMTGSLVAVRETLEKEFAIPAEPTEPTAPPPEKSVVVKYGRPPKPKVLIVGLWDKQVGMIDKEFNPILTLTYCHTDKISELKKTDLSGRHCLVMTDHVNHKSVDMIRSRGGDPVWVNGGMSGLRDMLTKIYVEDADRRAQLKVA